MVPKEHVRVYYRQKKGWGEKIINFTRIRSPTEVLSQKEYFRQRKDPQLKSRYVFGRIDVEYEPGQTKAEYDYFY